MVGQNEKESAWRLTAVCILDLCQGLSKDGYCKMLLCFVMKYQFLNLACFTHVFNADSCMVEQSVLYQSHHIEILPYWNYKALYYCTVYIWAWYLDKKD